MQQANASTVEDPDGARQRFGLGLVSFFHFAVLGSWLPILPLYCRETLGFRWEQAGLIVACVSVGVLFAPLIHVIARKLSIDARVGMAISHLLGAGISLGVGWSRQQTEFQSVDLWDAVLVVAAFSLVIGPTFHWMRELSLDFQTSPSRSWRLWGAVGFVLPAWITEFGMFRVSALSESVLSRDALWLVAGWAGVLSALATFAVPRIKHSTQPDDNPPTRQRVGVGFTLSLLLVLFAHRAQSLWMPVFFDRVLLDHQVTIPFEHRLLVVAQVFEVLALYLLAVSLAIIRVRLTMCLGALCWVARGVLLAWMNQTPMPGREALAGLFVGQVLAGVGLALFFGAFGSIVSNSRTRLLTTLTGVAGIISVLIAGVCAHRLLDSDSSPFEILDRLRDHIEIAGITWRLSGWNLLWFGTALSAVLAIPLALGSKRPTDPQT
jgi:hypothetical protein